ncbi:PD-(D/E)XK nuclease family protein [Pleomorphovibrio marinus]|uniref:PD-(D/E)XK nuclease family protein n=1 Tax=Pleomorphovibrio marinus TaxID=2164132 RepID=UPI000E0BEE61|nr:PD-(D/E)XK nuclease family protein [Pleomorphovibrio marinus]
MDRFLRQTAASLLATHKGGLQELTVVLPNRRAGVFFVKELSSLVNEPTWMPRVITIEDLFYDLGSQVPADKLTLIFELHQVYVQLIKDPEPLDRFYFWGELMLKDFNDIDQFRVDASKLYSRLAEIKAFEKDWSFLTPEQVTLIQTFWSSFSQRETEHQERFLRFWDKLSLVYERFKARLVSIGMAYSGMIYRKVVDDLDGLKWDGGKIAFVGFNAFTVCEEALVKFFIREHHALLFWDIDSYYVEDVQQEAGFFIRDYMKDKVLGPTFQHPIPERIGTKRTKIKTYTTPLRINQANIVGKILEGNKETEALEDTVVILPNENLLFPLLGHLPDQVSAVNVTMGYPIKNTPVYTFLEAVLELQRFRKAEDKNVVYYHKAVIDVLGSVYMQANQKRHCEEALSYITSTNVIYVSETYLTKFGGLFALVFENITGVAGLLERMGKIMNALYEQASENILESTYLGQCYKQLNRFRELLLPQQGKEALPLDFVIRLFKQIYRELKLPFEGEPLLGLQIMGVLESRNLDFRRVIICDMNEGSFPPSNSLNSLVPYNLRKAFGLPVQEQNDAIYAYTFYRLLHQSEEVHLIYTTAGEQGRVGEKSRYIIQVKEEMGISEEEKAEEVVFIPVDLGETKAIRIAKDGAILQVLDQYLGDGSKQSDRALSPSAINTYLDCRLRFYYKYIAKVEEEKTVSEDVDPAVFGNLAHAALEFLYVGFMERKKRRVVHAEDFSGLKDYVYPAIEMAIRQYYFMEEDKELKLGGHLAIARDVLQKYLLQILEIDRQTAPFEIVSLEKSKRYNANFEIFPSGNAKSVLLGGIIDRVDLHRGSIRLIDYKSGGDKKVFPGVRQLFDRDIKNRNKAAMQTLFYGLLYQYSHPENELPLKPAIFNLKELFNPNFSPYLEKKESRKDGVLVEDYSDYSLEVEEVLREVLEELFDTKVPFDQTDDLERCKWCAYKELCGR